MPLSEHEQRMLDEMEHALSVEDPKFASQMRGSARLARVRRNVVIGATGFLAGLALVVVGVMSQWWIGVIGFVLMVAGGAYVFKPTHANFGVVDESGHIHRPATPRRSGRSGGGSTSVRRGSNPRAGSFMERLEERWERRRRDGM